MPPYIPPRRPVALKAHAPSTLRHINTPGRGEGAIFLIRLVKFCGRESLKYSRVSVLHEEEEEEEKEEVEQENEMK
jgi:hypothetical protein